MYGAETKVEAIELRKQGYSLREIAKRLDVSVAICSNWLRPHFPLNGVVEVGGVRVRLPHQCKDCGLELNEDGTNFLVMLDNTAKSGKRYRSCCNACYIIRNSIRHDTRLRLDGCDLCPEFVRPLIEGECHYCGATNVEVRIGLDRVDNAFGHAKNNVVPCCVRCNRMRGNMPYVAWVVVAKAVREAKENGLFGSWVSGRE